MSIVLSDSTLEVTNRIVYWCLDPLSDIDILVSSRGYLSSCVRDHMVQGKTARLVRAGPRGQLATIAGSVSVSWPLVATEL